MTSLRATSAALLGLWLATSLAAADEPAPRHHMSDEVKARMLEEAKKKQPAPAAAETAKKDTAAENPDSRSASAKTPAPAATKTGKETPTVMPQVEVRNSRITVLDQKIAKQDQEIAREKQNTKPTEVDKALNDPKISKALSIFGGESSAQRATVSSERVKLMQDEREILEMMKTAKTKEEKAALQKELDELRAYRRELEKALR